MKIVLKYFTWRIVAEQTLAIYDSYASKKRLEIDIGEL